MAEIPHPGFVQYSVEYIGLALIYYDYALTWTREVKYIWMSKFRISTALYIACRYSMIANIVYLISLAGKLPSTISCDTGYQICSALSTIGLIGIITVLGMRTYALYGRSKLILAIFGSIGVTLVVIDAMHVRWVSCVPKPGKTMFEAAMDILVVVYEVLSAAFVTFRAWQAMRIRHSGIKLDRNQLEYLLLHEGILYFCFVSMFTFGGLILFYVAPSGSYVQRLLNGLGLPISGLMGARFLLYLRESNHKAEGGSEHKISQSIMFRVENTVSVEGEEDLQANNDNGSSEQLIDEFGQDPVRQAIIERRTQDGEHTMS